MSISDYAEAFVILMKYRPDGGPEPAYAYNEKLQVFVDPSLVDDEDLDRLESLGFRPKPDPHRVPPHFEVST